MLAPLVWHAVMAHCWQEQLAACPGLLWPLHRPTLLLVGNVTVDVVEGKRALGGAVSYAAAVASAMGVRACVVTANNEEADLSLFKHHDLYVVPSNATLTFEHTYTFWVRAARPPACPHRPPARPPAYLHSYLPGRRASCMSWASLHRQLAGP